MPGEPYAAISINWEPPFRRDFLVRFRIEPVAVAKPGFQYNDQAIAELAKITIGAFPRAAGKMGFLGVRCKCLGSMKASISEKLLHHWA